MSENCHTWNLLEYGAIKFVLTLEWHVWQKSLGCYMTDPNNRDQQIAVIKLPDSDLQQEKCS